MFKLNRYLNDFLVTIYLKRKLLYKKDEAKVGTYIENNTEDENINTNTEITKINNGIEIKIESIGEKEPPAFAISKNEETGIIEELLLPNRAYFQFPASGSIGSKTIYKIGISLLILGIFLLIIRNKNLIKNKK